MCVSMPISLDMLNFSNTCLYLDSQLCIYKNVQLIINMRKNSLIHSQVSFRAVTRWFQSSFQKKMVLCIKTTCVMDVVGCNQQVLLTNLLHMAVPSSFFITVFPVIILQINW